MKLGYEIGTGEQVDIPRRNMVVCGQTQESGKTTTLEALIFRSDGVSAVAFVTKRGEQSFDSGHRIPPYFRERADWQFVASVLEATMREKLKFERAWIMRASKGARTLGDVHANVKKALVDPKIRGMSADVYLTLDAYLEIVVPRIAKTKFSKALVLDEGLNVVDLSHRDTFPPELQGLVMRSVLEWVYENAQGTVTIIPEAWEFLPQGRGSPVKLAAIELFRKGSGLKNYVWLDSQDIGGVDKELLRSCPVWLLGVQREANEIARTLDNVPAGIAKPKAADIALLEKGQFYACYGKHVIKTYVQPAWMDDEDARLVALDKLSISAATKAANREPQTVVQISGPFFGFDEEIEHKVVEAIRSAIDERDVVIFNSDEEDEVKQETGDAIVAKLEQLTAMIGANPLDSGSASNATRAAAANNNDLAGRASRGQPPDEEALYQRFKARLAKEAPALLKVLTIKPQILVAEKVEALELDGKTLRGKLALMITKGFFDNEVAGNAAFNELKRVGFPTAKPNVYRECDKLAEMGFLTKEASGYRVVDGMKSSITRS